MKVCSGAIDIYGRLCRCWASVKSPAVESETAFELKTVIVETHMVAFLVWAVGQHKL